MNRVYREDIDLFFQRISEDNNFGMIELEAWIMKVASGKINLKLEDFEYNWDLENKVDMLTEENEDLMDTLQEARNTPVRNRDTEELQEELQEAIRRGQRIYENRIQDLDDLEDINVHDGGL